MKVVGVVLAAGLGTRLRPSTHFVPKPLIPVGGVEPLYFALFRAYALGIRKFVVNAHYLSEQVTAACALWSKNFPESELRVSVEDKDILGTGGALIKIVRDNQDWFSDHALLLQNGDTLAQIPLEKLVENPSECRFAVSYFPEHLRKYNPLWVDSAGLWTGIGKSPPTKDSKPAHFLGLHYISSKALKSIARKEKDFPLQSIDLFNGIYRPLSNEDYTLQSVDFDFASKNQNFWFDMTTQEFLLEAQHHVLDTLTSSPLWGELLKSRYPKIRELSPGVWATHSNQKIHFSPPVIWVEGESCNLPSAFSELQIGPHASFICEKGRVQENARAPQRSIKNSVVFVSGQKNLDIVEDLTNQLYVI